MYATCLFCHAPLGANESIEQFPIGRRLAFDSAKGRLWVVCSTCDRWNLSPLDERWEAIEQAERSYRDTKKRVTTDNIGLARMQDGTDLIRVGEPQRPEFAAWRYGSQLLRRRRDDRWRALSASTARVATRTVLLTLATPFTISLGAVRVVKFYQKYLEWESPLIALKAADGSPVHMTQSTIDQIRLYFSQRDGSLIASIIGRGIRATPWPLRALGVRQTTSNTAHLGLAFGGQASVRALAQIMAFVNAYGGNATHVEHAVQALEAADTPASLLRNLTYWQRRESSPFDVIQNSYSLVHLPHFVKLALEMSLHEHDERRALNGELAELERRWKDAEEIAAIADNLLPPFAPRD